MSAAATPAATLRFPDGFLWGAATSSHQVEGGNRWNDWWACEETGRLPFRSGNACDHFRRFAQDFDMARAWGHNAHRLSLEWSRIEPQDGVWDQDALAHYRGVVGALRERGMEPLLTLHHFTNPAWFAEGGGWLRPDATQRFARYVAFVARNLDAEVRYWLTVNEPTVYAKQAYVIGDWPPCRPGSWRQAAMALRRLCQAHVAAYRVLHRERPGCHVGLAQSAPYVVPCDPARALDRMAARVRDFALNDLCLRLVGGKRSLDFLGVNYYVRNIIRWRADGLMALVLGRECHEDHHGPARRYSDAGWEIYPDGLGPVLAKLARLGVPLIVTENGIATEDEAQRSEFLVRHLQSLHGAIAAGIDVRGYFHWSLMDNYEWTLGTAPRFGLAAVDFETLERRPRPAADLYAGVCTTNALTLPG